MIADFQTLFKSKDSFTSVLGQKRAKYNLKSALLVGRHVIILGAPGIGKTTLAKSIAELLPSIKDKKGKVQTGLDRFVRVQGSPDLTVEDLLGDIDPIKALKFGPSSSEAFTPGKIFKADNGVLFFDEVNRAPEKIQNSLLQVLQEGRATIGGYDVDMPTKFIFIGTMNPEEATATEKLSTVFMDRVDIIHMGYPESIELEQRIVNDHGTILGVLFPDKLLLNMLQFVRQLRDHKDIAQKPSVRVSLGLFERAQANAILNGNKKVSARDVQDAIISVLSHRIELKPSVKYLQTPEEFIAQEFKKFEKDTPAMQGGDDL